MLSGLTRFAFNAVDLVTTPSLSILMFHRVHPVKDEIFPQEPDAVRFEELMHFAASSFCVMTLGDAATRMAQGALPFGSLVITFDDGYADNVEIALPILQRNGLSATFFVSTGFLNGGRMWNDSVIECVRACSKQQLDLGAFDLGKPVLTDANARRVVIEQLLPRIKYLGLPERESAIAHLQRVSGVTHLPTDLMMGMDQLRELHRAGMEIGGHTVHHPILSKLPAPEAMAEIAQNKRHLEEIIDAPIDLFAYPNGRPDRDYDSSHVALLKQLGFRAAVSTAHGTAKVGDDLFQLPRFTPWDQSMGRWAMRLLINRCKHRFEVARDSTFPVER